MLFRIDRVQTTAESLPVAKLAALRVRERYDLQEWILHTSTILGEDLSVLTSEFPRFDRPAERLDLLALDRRGKLTVVELKRRASGTAAELQALRYAAFCSTLTLDDVIDMHREFLRRRGQDLGRDEVARRIIGFVEDPAF